MLRMPARDRTQPVRREELRLVEQTGEQTQDAADETTPSSMRRSPALAADRMRAGEQRGRVLVQALRAVDDLLVDRGDAEQRQHADDRAHLDRDERPSAGAAGRRRSRRPRPRAPASRAPRRSARSARGTSARGRSRGGRGGEDRRDRGHASARRSPSSRCRPTARAASPAGRCERSIGPMLSSPRNPPSKTFEPSRSWRFTHHVKLTSSLSKMRLRKSVSRPPSIAKTSSAAQACTGGLTSSNDHS